MLKSEDEAFKEELLEAENELTEENEKLESNQIQELFSHTENISFNEIAPDDAEIANSVSFSNEITPNSLASKYEIESNNSYSDANEIYPGDSITGVLSKSDDVDYYKITPNADGKLEISFLHTYEQSSSRWRVGLYKYSDGEYGKIGDFQISLDDNESVTLPFIGACGGVTYYIVIKEYEYTYGVRLMPKKELLSIRTGER